MQLAAAFREQVDAAGRQRLVAEGEAVVGDEVVGAGMGAAVLGAGLHGAEGRLIAPQGDGAVHVLVSPVPRPARTDRHPLPFHRLYRDLAIRAPSQSSAPSLLGDSSPFSPSAAVAIISIFP